MSVAAVCLGRHWSPYRYSRTRDDQDGSPVLPLPGWLRDLGRAALRDAYDDESLRFGIAFSQEMLESSSPLLHSRVAM